MKAAIKGEFYAFSHTGFSPRVRIVGRAPHDWRFPDDERVVCEVTGRDQAHGHHGYRPGMRFTHRSACMFRKCRVIRGTFGRLEYRDRLTDAELAALPVVRP